MWNDTQFLPKNNGRDKQVWWYHQRKDTSQLIIPYSVKISLKNKAKI